MAPLRTISAAAAGALALAKLAHDLYQEIAARRSAPARRPAPAPRAAEEAVAEAPAPEPEPPAAAAGEPAPAVPASPIAQALRAAEARRDVRVSQVDDTAADEASDDEVAALRAALARELERVAERSGGNAA
jgi:cytoskeletal protein RodZ